MDEPTRWNGDQNSWDQFPAHGNQSVHPQFDGPPPDAGFEQPAAHHAPPGRRRRAKPKKGRRRAIVVGLVVVLAMITGGAFAVVRFFMSDSVNPAERLPDSVVAYAEINLDPSLDQTPKLLDLINKLDVTDKLEDSEDLISELLKDLELEGVKPKDIESWLGRRAAVAVTFDGKEPQAVLALATTDDQAATKSLTKIRKESDDAFGYVVDEGLATLVFTEKRAQQEAELLVREGERAPLSESKPFADAVEWLGSDQVLKTWFDLDALNEKLVNLVPQEQIPAGVNIDKLMESYPGSGSFVLGVKATDNGVDVRYKGGAAGESQGAAGNAEWRDDIGNLRMSQVAGAAYLPDDLADQNKAFTDAMDQIWAAQTATPERLDEFDRGLWSYDEALSDDLMIEYNDLLESWGQGEFTEDSADFERMMEIENAWIFYGAQSEFDEWQAQTGGTEEEYQFSLALTHEEYSEFLVVFEKVTKDGASDAAWNRYYELAPRFHQHGLVSDYDQYNEVDPAAMLKEMYDLLSGAQFEFAVGDVFADKPKVGLAFTFAEGTAKKLLGDISGFDAAMDELKKQTGAELKYDGPTVSYGKVSGDTKLAEHDSFDAAFADAPDRASMAVFVDVASLREGASDAPEWLASFDTVSWVHGANSEGLIRVLIE